MRNNKVLIIILIILLVGIITFAFLNQNESIPVDFEWQAKYIGIENNSSDEKDNSWICFRKNFNVYKKNDIKNAICRIAADSKYWLYINGKIVVRDGQLKRGEKENSIYYDEINIEDYLQLGENNISILVWYFGKNGFSHVDSGQGSLLFQTQIGENIIVSDETWKAIKNPAYLNDEENKNNRLSESNIYYDSNLELGEWYLKEYDDSNWKNAIVYGKHDDARWGDLIKRDIPFFIFSEIKEYEKQEIDGNIIEATLPYNIQLVPYLKVKAKANEKIMISNDKEFNNEILYGKVTYITKEGIQEYESPSWINGDKIYYYIPQGVEVIALGYRETGYDTQMSGNFECNDNQLNSLWKMANRTLYVNMRDTFMDCPDRERAMWIGDTSLEMEEAMYGLDVASYDLYEKCVKTFIGWQNNGVFNTVAPSINANLQLPVQNLLAICSMYDYYQYTGNKDFLNYVYPNIKEYMTLWNFGDDGIVSGNGYYYLNISPWYDSQGNIDFGIAENMWYYYALQNLYKISNELGFESDANEYKIKLDKMKKGINEKFWDGAGYKSDSFEGYDVRVNSIAVLSGIAEDTKYDTIEKVIKDNYDNSVFMEKYILQALSEMEKIEIVQERIKTRYSQMIENQNYSTTLWEYWQKEHGSKNHAWAGGPLVIMSKYFAGIRPLKAGYSEILIKPEFGKLNTLNARVNTIQGTVEMEAEKKDKLKLQIDVPSKVLVAIEKMSNDIEIKINNVKIYEKGIYKTNKLSTLEKEDDRYVYVFLEKGKYFIESK